MTRDRFLDFEDVSHIIEFDGSSSKPESASAPSLTYPVDQYDKSSRPYWHTQNWPDQTLVSSFLNICGAFWQVSPQKTMGLVCFGAGITNMLTPTQIM